MAGTHVILESGKYETRNTLGPTRTSYIANLASEANTV